ncbi:MAG TPA: UdgX family uracil-DNA binding protein [Intrasporangium sp.]|uniref:UdgX family uracil-DNA binding protein n=1 Tax=Intrasporangium sp. TaxID=1925024 RepID=UPI002D76A040|nr:UdgX family uracil-DNA binding protein [Intrasporangium sp.]HET7399151.1 UdgX family uracil-DNA binding protein [Intrasporangium sp.]
MPGPDFPGAESFLPPRRSLPSLATAVQGCRGCDLYREATQAVFGDGSADARLVLVGEQPGDAEDRAGEPFVGPAGRVLDRALEEAGIAREQVWVTNAVKHFRFTQQGKRRIHESPSRWQVAACQPWLLAELDALRPEGLVLLGATAGKALLGPGFRVGASRGRVLEPLPTRQEWVVATIHPSAVLRARERDELYAGLTADLAVARERLAGRG